LAQRKSQKKANDQSSNLKKTILFEAYGLIFLAISIIALVQLGAVGKAFRGIFRFFAGSWDFVIPLFMIGLSFYMMWKRALPKRLNRFFTGVLIICLSILILSHLSLVKTVTADGKFGGQSIVGLTWDLYKEDVTLKDPNLVEDRIETGRERIDLGGGMIGALFYSGLHLLFDPTGTKLVVFFLILIGILLITGKSYTDMVIGIQNKAKKFIEWIKEKGSQYKEIVQQDAEENTVESAPSIHINDGVQDHLEVNLSEEPPIENKRSRKRNDKLNEMIPPPTYTGVSQKEEQSNRGVHTPLIHDFTEVAYSQGEIKFPELGESKNGQGEISMEAHKNGLQVEGKGLGDLSTQEGDPFGGEVLAFEEEEAEEENYQLPPYSLLVKQDRKKTAEKKDLASNARKLEQTLQSFGVSAKVTNVHRGPAVTRYEVHPDVGVKVSRIVSLTDDIALALAAKGIRMEAPIPGKSAIGIEVPNEDVTMVSFREVLESSKYHESESKVSIALGRDISGDPIVAQLNKMPHLLVAGATGSGKSVCINGIIASILYKAKPHEVKLMMIDPKMVELNVYNGIPHLLAPVVTDSRKASIALKKVVSEMERRYEIFAQSGTRDIERYNDLIKKENLAVPEVKKPLLPYIVVIVDELADLMMVAPGDVEDAICRLAQMARAAGIHLIIATQRPSVDVITGVIKANIPSRIAFGVSSMADSRTILDMGGAEKLLGRGDMLFCPVGASKPQRIQGAFISDEEIQAIVDHCIEQQKAKYQDEMIPTETEETSVRSEVEDDLYKDAVELVIHQGTASVSMLQRRFRVGYARAARLIDSMEANGIVGPYEGSKPREVLISKEESHIS
jgi:S-DNA-T family DNA segregation ATPase FtsK/SpoIIIE